MSDASETPDAASLAARLAERECELIDLRQRVQRYAEDLAWAESQGFLTELVRGLAHELNNPLAVILGHAQRMGYRLDDRDDCRRRLQLICNEVDSCIGLVERLRRYAAPPREEVVPCDLALALARATERLQQRGVRLPRVIVAETLPPVLAGPRALARVLEQVLDNASGAQAWQVRVSGSRREDEVLLHLDNDGRAPSEEEIANASKPFYTTRAEDGHRGLGVALATQLVRDMGGTIHLDRIPGSDGARVRISLPAPGLAPAVEPAARATVGASAGPVLIVDDQPLIAELLRDALEECSHPVIVCNSCAEAEAVRTRGGLGAMFCDLRLPDGSGAELLRAAADTALRGHLVLVTGDPEAPEVRQVVSETGCAVLAKPFRHAEVFALSRQVLG